MPMKITILAKNLELTDAIREYVNQKTESFSKLLRDEADPVVEVELSKEQPSQHAGEDLYKAEVNLVITGHQVYADSTESDLYAAIDTVKDVVLRELRQHKERTTDENRSGARAAKAMLRNQDSH